MRYSIPLSAGVERRQPLSGRCIVILSTGAADAVTLTLERGNEQAQDSFGQVQHNFSVYDAGGGGFSGAILESAVDTTVEVIVTNYDARSRSGDSVTATIDPTQLPLPVETSRGLVPGTPLYVSGITYSDTPAGSAVDRAAVAVTAAGAVLLAADATRLRAYFTNIGNDAVALGAPGITWAKRAILLYPGDSWLEEKGAALAWSAITDAGTDASVTIQELKA